MRSFANGECLLAAACCRIIGAEPVGDLLAVSCNGEIAIISGGIEHINEVCDTALARVRAGLRGQMLVRERESVTRDLALIESADEIFDSAGRQIL